MPLRTRFLEFVAAHEEFGAYNHLGLVFDDDFVFDFAALPGDAPTTHNEEQAFPFWWPFDTPWPFDPPAEVPSTPDDGWFILFDRPALEAAWAAILENLQSSQPDLPEQPSWPFG